MEMNYELKIKDLNVKNDGLDLLNILAKNEVYQLINLRVESIQQH